MVDVARLRDASVKLDLYPILTEQTESVTICPLLVFSTAANCQLQMGPTVTRYRYPTPASPVGFYERRVQDISLLDR